MIEKGKREKERREEEGLLDQPHPKDRCLE